jgi:hypothetical protein
MSNLIPLHLDKDTGEYVAKFRDTGTLPPGTSLTLGYTFVVIIPVTTWVIPHNNNTDNLVIQIYDTSNQLITPDQVDVTNVNTVTVHFAVPQAGKAQLVLFTAV